jgi:hypothetical protein
VPLDPSYSPQHPEAALVRTISLIDQPHLPHDPFLGISLALEAARYLMMVFATFDLDIESSTIDPSQNCVRDHGSNITSCEVPSTAAGDGTVSPVERIQG